MLASRSQRREETRCQGDRRLTHSSQASELAPDPPRGTRARASTGAVAGQTRWIGADDRDRAVDRAVSAEARAGREPGRPGPTADATRARVAGRSIDTASRATSPSLPASRRAVVASLTAACMLILSGCSTAHGPSSQATSESPPEYVSEPFTHQQELVERGARLAVSDGCTACHLTPSLHRAGPSFESFAGHRVTLGDGRRAIVDEAFIEHALTHPGSATIKGYSARPMREMLARTHLYEHPSEVRALAAFVEQIGPETP